MIMDRTETREFFFQFYRRRKDAFLKHLYEAASHADVDEIHKTRIEAKKINAFYQFLEMIAPAEFSAKNHSRVLRDLFKQSGKIREIQLHFFYLDQYFSRFPGFVPFKKFLSREETREREKFLSLLGSFDPMVLKEEEAFVEKLCKKISLQTVERLSDTFIRKESGKIKKLVSEPDNLKNVHKTRQHLKSIVAIAGLSDKISPTTYLDGVRANAHRTEVMIGNWHDRVVLLEAIKDFQHSEAGKGVKIADKTRSMIMHVTEETEWLLIQVLSEVHNFLLNSLHSNHNLY
jgi:hypothetical protein